jgi:hypothetical protein
MLKNQNNVGWICKGSTRDGRSLSIDHCHKTGKIRGLLCKDCNIGLGHFKDNIKLLQKAEEYLTSTQ